MKQLPEGTGLRRIALVGIFLLVALAGLPAILSAIVPTLPEVETTEEASGATAGLAWTDEQAEDLILAQYEAALAGRARLDFHESFTDGDSLTGFWPATLGLARVFKVGGEWAPGMRAWFIPRDETGRLCLVLDRAVKTSLGLTIEFYDGPPESSSLSVDLVDENEQVLATSELYGNMLAGSEAVVTRAILVPLPEYPTARGIYLRGRGELFVLGVSLESGVEWLTAGEREDVSSATVPEQSGAGGVSEPAPPASEGASAAGPSGTAKRHLAAGAAPLPSRLVKTKTLAQFVMSDEHFIMTRAAFGGGGGRLSSTDFILEDTFGQSSTIGFSYGSGVTLHWGFQQAEIERIAASVRLEPEALKVNPGILTAFVSLPEGLPVAKITSATCDGALYERMMLSDDATEMIIKFRRQDIEAALAEQGEMLDTHFVVEGTWQGPEGVIPFVGEDDIARIVN